MPPEEAQDQDTQPQAQETSAEELSVEAILGYDPHEDDGGSSDTQQAENEASGSEDHTGQGDQDVGGETQESQTEGQETSEGESQEQTQPAEDPEKAQLRDTVNQLQQTVAQMQQQMQQNQQGQGQQQGEAQGEGQQDLKQFVPDYNFQVPNETRKLLQSDSPEEFEQGLMQIQQGYAQTVHYNLLEQMQQMYNTIEQRIPEVAQQQATQTTKTEEIKQDFFGNYPELDNENLKPLVAQVSEQVLQQNPNAGWTPEIRDQIGQQVRQILQSVNGGGQQQQQQQQAPPAQGGSQQPQGGQQNAGPAAPPQQYGGGSRPAQDGPDGSNDVIQTLLG